MTIADEVTLTAHERSLVVTGTHEIARRDFRRPLEQNLQQQLHALFGESLFGSWHVTLGGAQLPVNVSRTHVSRKRARVAMALALMMATALGAVGFVVLKRAQETRRAERRVLLHTQLDDLTRMSAFAALGTTLKGIEHELLTGDDGRTLRGAVALAEAMLHRFHDASPTRRDRALDLLLPDADAPPIKGADLRMVPLENTPLVTTVLSSDYGKLTAIDALRKLSRSDETHPAAVFLMARTYGRAGLKKEASVMFTQARRLEPGNQLHAAYEAIFRASHKQLKRAYNIATEIEDIDPKAPITRFTRDMLEIVKGKWSPAEVARWHRQSTDLPAALRAEFLLHVIGYAQSSPAPSAEEREALTAFVNVVHGEPTFLLDGADFLQRKSKNHSALWLLDALPAGSETLSIHGLRGRLLASVGDDNRAFAELSKAYGAKYVALADGLTLLSLCTADTTPTAEDVARRLHAEHPRRAEITLRLAAFSMEKNEFKEARSLLAEVLPKQRQRLPASSRSWGLYTDALLAAEDGETQRSRELASKALRLGADDMLTKRIDAKLAGDWLASARESGKARRSSNSRRRGRTR